MYIQQKALQTSNSILITLIHTMIGLYIPVDSEFFNMSFHGDHLEYPDGFRMTSYEEDTAMKTDA